MINVFITIKNNPKLNITAGSVKIINNGFMKAFNKLSTTDTRMAVRKLSTDTPGNM